MHPARRIASACGAVCAGLLTGFAATPAPAAADPVLIAGAGSGLSAPTGVARTPDGALWVSDPLAGICRVSVGEPVRLSESPWCMPGRQEELDSDLFDDLIGAGGAPGAEAPPARLGPAAPSGLAFDARTGYLYASDRASSGGSIWRFRLDPVTGDLDEGDVVATTTDRVETITLGPATGGRSGPDVFFVAKRSGWIMRVADPAGEPRAPIRVAPVTGGDVAGMTATEDALFVAHGGLTRFTLDPLTGDARSQPMSGLGTDPISAVIADPARGRLYAGTTSGSEGEDMVKVVDLATGSVEDYELGFRGVTALGVDAGGELLVADDPIVATGAEGTRDEGRLWQVAHHPLNRPAVSITGTPPAVSAASSIAFTYSSRTGASFECRLDDEPFTACDGSGDGQQTYGDLAEGEHRFSVRAHDGVTGLPASWSFRLDRTAPKVVVRRPSGDFVEGGPEPRIHFDVDEAGVSFECSLDAGPYRECWSGNRLEDLAAGTHTLRVVGTDAAGNRSDADAADASVAVTVRPRPRTAVPAPIIEPAPVAIDPGAEVRPTVDPPARVTTVARKPRLRNFGVRLRGNADSARARLEIRFAAPQRGSRLKLALRNPQGRVVLSRTITARKTGVTLTTTQLTRSERRRLTPGRYQATGVLRAANGARSEASTRLLRIAR